MSRAISNDNMFSGRIEVKIEGSNNTRRNGDDTFTTVSDTPSIAHPNSQFVVNAPIISQSSIIGTKRSISDESNDAMENKVDDEGDDDDDDDDDEFDEAEYNYYRKQCETEEGESPSKAPASSVAGTNPTGPMPGQVNSGNNGATGGSNTIGTDSKQGEAITIGGSTVLIVQKWSPYEDALLKEGITIYGSKSWKAVSKHVGTRDPAQCLQRWVKSLRPGIVKGRWSNDEDNILRGFVDKCGIVSMNWKQVAIAIPGRTSKQCRERWFNYLDPTLKPGGTWTKEEDETLWMLVEQYGRKWAHVARMMPGRTENVVKVRYNGLRRQAGLPKNDPTRQFMNGFIPPDPVDFFLKRPKLAALAAETFGFSIPPMSRESQLVSKGMIHPSIVMEQVAAANAANNAAGITNASSTSASVSDEGAVNTRGPSSLESIMVPPVVPSVVPPVVPSAVPSVAPSAAPPIVPSAVPPVVPSVVPPVLPAVKSTSTNSVGGNNFSGNGSDQKFLMNGYPAYPSYGTLPLTSTNSTSTVTNSTKNATSGANTTTNSNPAPQPTLGGTTIGRSVLIKSGTDVNKFASEYLSTMINDRNKVVTPQISAAQSQSISSSSNSIAPDTSGTVSTHVPAVTVAIAPLTTSTTNGNGNGSSTVPKNVANIYSTAPVNNYSFPTGASLLLPNGTTTTVNNKDSVTNVVKNVVSSPNVSIATAPSSSSTDPESPNGSSSSLPSLSAHENLKEQLLALMSSRVKAKMNFDAAMVPTLPPVNTGVNPNKVVGLSMGGIPVGPASSGNNSTLTSSTSAFNSLNSSTDTNAPNAFAPITTASSANSMTTNTPVSSAIGLNTSTNHYQSFPPQSQPNTQVVTQQSQQQHNAMNMFNAANTTANSNVTAANPAPVSQPQSQLGSQPNIQTAQGQQQLAATLLAAGMNPTMVANVLQQAISQSTPSVQPQQSTAPTNMNVFTMQQLPAATQGQGQMNVANMNMQSGMNTMNSMNGMSSSYNTGQANTNDNAASTLIAMGANPSVVATLTPQQQQQQLMTLQAMFQQQQLQAQQIQHQQLQAQVQNQLQQLQQSQQAQQSAPSVTAMQQQSMALQQQINQLQQQLQQIQQFHSMQMASSQQSNLGQMAGSASNNNQQLMGMGLNPNMGMNMNANMQQPTNNMTMNNMGMNGMNCMGMGMNNMSLQGHPNMMNMQQNGVGNNLNNMNQYAHLNMTNANNMPNGMGMNAMPSNTVNGMTNCMSGMNNMNNLNAFAAFNGLQGYGTPSTDGNKGNNNTTNNNMNMFANLNAFTNPTAFNGSNNVMNMNNTNN